MCYGIDLFFSIFDTEPYLEAVNTWFFYSNDLLIILHLSECWLRKCVIVCSSQIMNVCVDLRGLILHALSLSLKASFCAILNKPASNALHSACSSHEPGLDTLIVGYQIIHAHGRYAFIWFQNSCVDVWILCNLQVRPECIRLFLCMIGSNADFWQPYPLSLIHCLPTLFSDCNRLVGLTTVFN